MKGKFPAEGTLHYGSRTFKVFDPGESAENREDSGLDLFSESIAFLPRHPELHIRATVRGADPGETEAKLARIEEKLRERWGDRLFGVDGQTMERIVGELLNERKGTLATAESCTGGLAAHRLTNVPGSSAYFERGVVAYSNRAKTEWLGVSEELIARLGAVSAPVAEEMAGGIRRLARTTLGLGITGIAGPGGGSPEKPVGTVFVALAGPDGAASRGYLFRGDREEIKAISAQTALDWARRYLLFGGIGVFRK